MENRLESVLSGGGPMERELIAMLLQLPEKEQGKALQASVDSRGVVLLDQLRLNLTEATRQELVVALQPYYHPDFPEVKLYAPEDTGMLMTAVHSALGRMPQPRVMVDLCTGDSLVPHQALVDQDIERAMAVDIDTKKAEKFTGSLPGSLDLSGGCQIKKMNILKPDIDFLKDFTHSDDHILVSANPPWIPVPENFQASPEYDDAVLAISAGPAGLKYYHSIMNIANGIGAESIALNVPSIVDIAGLEILLIINGFKIDHIDILHTYSYGFDALPSIQRQYKNFSLNCYRYDEEGNLRYLLMGMVLKKALRKEVDDSMNRLRSLFIRYSDNSDFLNLNVGMEDFCRLWELNDEDRSRILNSIR